jgi:hypothetical protein
VIRACVTPPLVKCGVESRRSIWLEVPPFSALIRLAVSSAVNSPDLKSWMLPRSDKFCLRPSSSSIKLVTEPSHCHPDGQDGHVSGQTHAQGLAGRHPIRLPSLAQHLMSPLPRPPASLIFNCLHRAVFPCWSCRLAQTDGTANWQRHEI